MMTAGGSAGGANCRRRRDEKRWGELENRFIKHNQFTLAWAQLSQSRLILLNLGTAKGHGYKAREWNVKRICRRKRDTVIEHHKSMISFQRHSDQRSAEAGLSGHRLGLNY